MGGRNKTGWRVRRCHRTRRLRQRGAQRADEGRRPALRPALGRAAGRRCRRTGSRRAARRSGQDHRGRNRDDRSPGGHTPPRQGRIAKRKSRATCRNRTNRHLAGRPAAKTMPARQVLPGTYCRPASASLTKNPEMADFTRIPATPPPGTSPAYLIQVHDPPPSCGHRPAAARQPKESSKCPCSAP